MVQCDGRNTQIQWNKQHQPMEDKAPFQTKLESVQKYQESNLQEVANIWLV
jgi:hypothetical protein